MKINDFKLECYFGKYEFTAPYLLTQSDCESMSTRDLLALEPGAQKNISPNGWATPRPGAIPSCARLSRDAIRP